MPEVGEMLLFLTMSFAYSYYEYQMLPTVGKYNLQPNLPGNLPGYLPGEQPGFEYTTIPSHIDFDNDFRGAAPKQENASWSSWTKCLKGISGWFQTRMRKRKCPNIQVSRCSHISSHFKLILFHQDGLQT